MELSTNLNFQCISKFSHAQFKLLKTGRWAEEYPNASFEVTYTLNDIQSMRNELIEFHARALTFYEEQNYPHLYVFESVKEMEKESEKLVDVLKVIDIIRDYKHYILDLSEELIYIYE
ncbi:hypothetical protein ABMA71_16570 [Halobacteriovorax sp. ZH3_bin.1]|uniref:hypothetical protein n=1 Tax=Halobacteriovorax sp. ZH3_bin.1 TaxID=3157725 RepID=UPI0037205A3C